MPTDPLAAVLDDLDADLRTLLHRRGVPVRAIEPVAGIDSPFRRPRTFRVELADGQLLKVVRATGPPRAALVFAISRRLDRTDFAPVLAHEGAGLLMRWIEGRPLPGAGWDTPDVRHAGRVLAALHAIEMPEYAAPGAIPVDLYVDKLGNDLTSLTRRAAIAHEERDAALELAAAYAPDVAIGGVIHRDLCADNLVRQPSGRLCVIDVDSMAIGAFAYDLARTWCRWPMSAAQRAALLDAYVAHGGTAPDWRHFPFWATCAVASSVAQRRIQSPELAFAPLRRLRALLRDLRAGIDGERLAMQG